MTPSSSNKHQQTNQTPSSREIFDSDLLYIFYENIDGISNHKIPDLLASSSTADYHIIIFTETWLNLTVKKEILHDQYTVYRKDRDMTSISRTASQGGGVLIAVRSNMKCELYTNNLMTDLEAICVRIPLTSGQIYIYCLYIQPTASIDIYRSHVAAIKQLMSDKSISDTILIFGDFNFGNSVSWQENDTGFDFSPIFGESQSIKSTIARETIDSLFDNELLQISSFQNTSGNVLDTLFTNVPELSTVELAEFPLLPPAKSDKCHVPIMCTLECTPALIQSDDGGSIYCFRKANFNDIREYLSGFDLSGIIESSSNLNETVATLYDVLRETIDKFVPKSSIRCSNKPKWHDKQLTHLKNIRNN